MSPTAVGAIVFVCTLGGALTGMWLNSILPPHHISEKSENTVKLAIGLIATMTALVLGLVTASAKSSFDTVDTAVKHTATDILTLDRLLARYGPETGVRATLRQAIAHRIDLIWPTDSSRPALRGPQTASVESIADQIRALKPRDDYQRSLQSRAVDLSEALLQARWVVLASVGTSVPLPFLAILLFWLTITFTSFGLFAPRNATVVSALFVCALSVAGAVFLVLEMDGPFDGVLRASAEPLRSALTHLKQ